MALSSAMKNKVGLVIFSLIVAITVLKFWGLLVLPIFVDEGLYCFLGYQTKNLGVINSWNLIVNSWKLAPFLPFLNNWGLKIFSTLPPIFVCRGIVILISGLGAWWLWLVSRYVTQDFRIQIGAVLFYLINPLSFFMDRTNLMEPVFNAVALFYIYLICRTLHRFSVKNLWLIFGALLLVLLTKQSAILVLPMPFILTWSKDIKHAWIKLALFTLVFGLTSVLLLKFFTPIWQTAAIHMATNLEITNLWLRLKTNLWLIINWLIAYFTWLIIPLSILGGWELIRQRKIGWLLAPIMIITAFSLFGWTLFPRYLLIIVPFLAVIIGWALYRKLGIVLGIILLIVFLSRDTDILFRPIVAKIAQEDHFQFFTDWTSGAGIKLALKYLTTEYANQPISLLLPQDLTGTWVISKLSFIPRQIWEEQFYASQEQVMKLTKEALGKKIPVILVTTTHHQSLTEMFREFYKTQLIFTSNGLESNSVILERILRE